jgi:hypothetical protein
MLSTFFSDVHGCPGDWRVLPKLVKLASNHFADKRISSTRTAEIALHPYSGIVFGQ